MSSEQLVTAKRRRPFLRGLVFRLGAIVLGLLPLVLAEAAFTLLDWVRPGYGEDPFVGFHGVRPLFALDEEESLYRTAPSRLDFFRPESFAADKPADEFRIFCLGGSTVQGRPFAIETSLTTWLEIALAEADNSHTWEVVNCGGVSYASYRLVPILEEVLQYQPDLIVLCTGHNEFLEDRTYDHIKNLPAPLAWPCELVASTRSFNLLAAGYRNLTGAAAGQADDQRPVLQTEVDAILEYQGGLEQYHRDEKWRRDTIDHFSYNLRRMVEATRAAGVPMLLVNPVANLRDCPPFKTEHREGITPKELELWNGLIDKAKQLQGTDMHQAIAALEQAREIDDQHAGLHYILAKCYDALARNAEARNAYIKAKELDVCPLRILEPMHRAILDVADSTGVWLVDVSRLYDQLSEAGIPGKFLLVDHVHPSIAGHQLIAAALADELIRRGVVHPKPGWKARRDQAFHRHLGSLDELYFAKGQQRLEMLRCWTQGKASGVRNQLPPVEQAPSAE